MMGQLMKIAVIGAGAMGSAVGGLLAKAGNDVTLVDVSRATLDAVNTHGLRVDDKAGRSEVIRLPATDNVTEVGVVDLVVVFVKCYHTEAAVRAAAPLIGDGTVVLSLQNGWGNGPRIAEIIGKEKLLLGVCYHSATVLAPGHVLHAGRGMTFMGEPEGGMSERLRRVADTFNRAGVEVTAVENVLKEIWAKLALNVATLPTSAALRLYAPQLLDTEGMKNLMRELLKEVVAVARAQQIPMDFDERWESITGLLGKLAPATKGSMIQDVENGRRTEIDVINGAIVEAGRRFGVPTPYNNAMVWMIKAVEAAYPQASSRG
jgi:2-dehydropantoate 2-reductase